MCILFKITTILPCTTFLAFGETADCTKFSVPVCSSLATYDDCNWRFNSNKLGEQSIWLEFKMYKQLFPW